MIREDEQYLGNLKVVQINRRSYETGKPTEVVVIGEDGKRKIATKFGEALDLSSNPKGK
jgi:hypothetical protein